MPMPTETDVLRIEALRRQHNKEVRDEGAAAVPSSVRSDAGPSTGHHLPDPHVLGDAECGHAADRTPSSSSEGS